MVATGGTNIQQQGDFLHNYCVTARWQSQQCSQYPSGPFLKAVQLIAVEASSNYPWKIKVLEAQALK